MKIGREELEDLKEGLEKLTHFIRVMEGVKLPDFYRYFDAMKNNINIFFYAGCEDIEDFFPILERDWKASHTMFIGVQNYDLRREHPDIDPTVCLYFARLLADVGKYFERGNVVLWRSTELSFDIIYCLHLIKQIYKNDYSLVCFCFRVTEKTRRRNANATAIHTPKTTLL